MAVVRFKDAAEGARIAKARDMRRKLYKACRNACEALGADLSGFALVVWDKGGNLQSSYDASEGIVAPALVPTLVGDALNRHIAVVLARIDGDLETGR